MSDQAIINDISKAVGSIRTNTKGINKDSEDILKSWEGLTRQGKGMLGHVERWVSSNTQLKGALSAINDTMEDVGLAAFRQRQELNLAKQELQDIVKRKTAGLAVDDKVLATAKQNFANQVQLNRLTQEYQKAWEKLHTTQLSFTSGVGVLMIALLREAGRITAQWNVALTAANDVTQRRYDLLKDISEVHRDTGSEVAEISENARALVEYGLESKAGFQDSLKVVTQLRQTLGLSAEDSAEMAVMAERMNVSFRGVADTLVRIVDSTALSAQEAKKYADELGRAAMFMSATDRSRAFGPGGSLELVGRLEGAIKEAGGQQGELTRLVSEMQSTLEGSLQAGVFGLNPAALGTEQGVQRLTDSLSRLVAQAQTLRDAGNQQGYLAVLEQVRMLTNDRVSLQTLNALVAAQRQVASQRKSDITLEQRWKDQLAQTGQLWERLRNTFQGILIDGLMPLLKIGRLVLTWIVDLTDFLKKVPGLMKAVSIVVTILAAVTIPLAIAKFYQLATALIAASLAASRLAKATAAQAATQGALDLGGPGSVGRGGLRGVGRKVAATLKLGPLREFMKIAARGTGALGGASGSLMSVSALPIAGIVAAVVASLAAGVGLGLLINKWAGITKDLNFARIGAAEKEGRERFVGSYRSELNRLVKAGNIDDIKAYADHFQKTALTTRMFGEGAVAQYKVSELLKESAKAAQLVSDIKSGRAQLNSVPSEAEVRAAEMARVQVEQLKESNETQKNIWAEESKRTRLAEVAVREEADRRSRQELYQISRTMISGSNTNIPTFGPR